MENIVIRQLGVELAQARVDSAFANGRLILAREYVMAVMSGRQEDPEFLQVLGTLLALLG